MPYTHGRASLVYKSGREVRPCDNCGTTHATMYELRLAKTPGAEATLAWTLCVTCRSHLEGVFTEHACAHIDVY